jgi:hypothetical protein
MARPVPGETVRQELLALKSWADDQNITHPIVDAWAEQVSMWCSAHLERLDRWTADPPGSGNPR